MYYSICTGTNVSSSFFQARRVSWANPPSAPRIAPSTAPTVSRTLSTTARRTPWSAPNTPPRSLTVPTGSGSTSASRAAHLAAWVRNPWQRFNYVEVAVVVISITIFFCLFFLDMSFHCLGDWEGANGERFVALMDTKAQAARSGRSGRFGAGAGADGEQESSRPRYRCAVRMHTILLLHTRFSIPFFAASSLLPAFFLLPGHAHKLQRREQVRGHRRRRQSKPAPSATFDFLSSLFSSYEIPVLYAHARRIRLAEE